ncbi:MAG: SAM-dependent methyltransferase, partial [Pseudonocardiaceae bacterium]
MTDAPQPGHDDDRMIPLAGHYSAEAVLGTVGVVKQLVSVAETVAANRRWWDADAADYLAEHG